MTKVRQVVEELRAGAFMTSADIKERYKLARPWDSMSQLSPPVAGLRKTFVKVPGVKRPMSAYFIVK